MNRKGMGLFVLGAIFVSLLLLQTAANANLPYGNVLFVDDDFANNDAGNNKFNRIQYAIDNATDGDIIFVFSGEYEENLFVNKRVVLMGESAGDVIIDGNSRLYAVNILASDVVMENFTIMRGLGSTIRIHYDDVTVKNCIITESEIGMDIEGNNISIINCSIYNVPTAITMKGDNISIINCSIYNADWGINATECSNSSIYGIEAYDIENKAIKMDSSEHMVIEVPTIHDSFCGIWFLNTSNSTLIGGNISSNKMGIKMEKAYFNEIKNSLFLNNFGYGIYSTDSYANLIHHNNFIGNGINAYDTGANIWNSSVGNYWDDYSATDSNQDGIGDVPYAVGSNMDYRPLVYEISSSPMFVWVDDDYDSTTPGWGIDHFDEIQMAIDAVQEGGECYVYPGYYAQEIVVEKRLTLVGEDAVIDSPGEGIFILASYVRVEGFTIYADMNGIKVLGAMNVSIYNCSATDAIFGAYLINSMNCSIGGSEFYDCMKGIFLFNVSHSSIWSNKLHNNSYFGMEISHGSMDNMIYDNTFENNGNYGLCIVQNSNGNGIYHNNFLNNPSYDECDNSWNGLREDAIGNYWWDYDGTDANRDGMGDEPYFINGGAIDEYPLMNPVQNPPLFVWVNGKYGPSFPGWGLDHFTSVGNAIDNVVEAGGCHIFDGIYVENIIVSKRMFITGEEGSILDGNGEMVVYINSDDVELINLNVRNAWDDAGIKITGSNVRVEGCSVYNNYYGITTNGMDIQVEGCGIFDNSYAGILMQYTSSSEIKDCEIYGNNNGMIMRYAFNNTVEGSRIVNNFVNGVWLFQCHDNVFHHSDFENNAWGVYLQYSPNNVFHLNNFVGNGEHVYDNTVNVWNDSVGNYWDDYSGTDLNEDGIGDVPYRINGYGMDYRPLIRRAGLPVAYFSFAPTTPYTYQSVSFYDNSVDLDGTIVAWQWDFGDGNTSNEQNPTHFYADNGVYIVNLTIFDNDGNNGSIEKEITVLNTYPVANFTWVPEKPTDIEEVTFNASSSYDIDGMIVNYTWDFGDGSIAYGMEVKHSYDDNGVYEITLTVMDDDGDTASISHGIMIENNNPVANFTWTPEEPTDIDEIVFNASSSYDIDGMIVNYTWDFGDGSIAYGMEVKHVYPDNGTYIVRLSIEDDDGGTDFISKIMEIKNVPPSAFFDYTPDEPNDVEPVKFMDHSYDADGEIVNISWQFGDGNYSYEKNPEHIYAENGIYTVVLTVVDNDGSTSSTSRAILIRNVPPVANFTWTPEEPTDIQDVSFISHSYDEDGEIVNHTWDFGDGNISYTENATHRYGDDGNYTVKLIVKDDDNDIGVMSVWLTIKNKPPTALFTFKPEKPRQDEVVTFNASASKDADGEIKNYSWDFESDGIIDAYGEEVKHAFGEKKPYTVTLTVVDDDGAQDTFTFVVNVREKEKTPGFELMILLAASAILIFMKRRRIGIWRM